MAVYTDVSDEALARFLNDYDIGQVVSFKGIAGGVENSNFYLQTDRDAYILTLYEKRVAEADLPFFVGLMDHLAARGFPCPKPIRDKGGQAIKRLENRPAAIVSFLSGVDVQTPSLDQCRMAGEALADLHQASQGFEISRANALAPAGWPALAKASGRDADKAQEGLADLIESELAVITAAWPNDIPTGVIHADFFRDNVFFLDGKLSGVIDFYFACNDYLAYDIAVTINAWCFDKSLVFLPGNAAAILEGYRSRRPLQQSECDALAILARGAALRFLLTRIYDWLNVPKGALVLPHDPTEFSARLRFFRDEGAAVFADLL
ncbi:MAG: homoserine kinase [Ahrensia sp.]|nr:homoserine kinase [Ahrensia sp.]